MTKSQHRGQHFPHKEKKPDKNDDIVPCPFSASQAVKLIGQLNEKDHRRQGPGRGDTRAALRQADNRKQQQEEKTVLHPDSPPGACRPHSSPPPA